MDGSLNLLSFEARNSFLLLRVVCCGPRVVEWKLARVNFNLIAVYNAADTEKRGKRSKKKSAEKKTLMHPK